MAKVLILGVRIPFVRGGQDVLVQTLVKELIKRGHDTDVLELPLSMLPKEGLLRQAAIWRSLELEDFGGQKADILIATKFPSYYARHPRKSIWLVHQHRAIYDLYGSRYSDFSDDPRDEALRRALMGGDTKVISEAAYVSGISKNVMQRLKEYNGISGRTLYPPLPMGGRYYCEEPDDYILSVGRLCSIKRVDLMIKALPMVHHHIKLKIVGTADESAVMEYYKNEISKHHLWDRVEFLGRVDEDSLLKLFAKALAVYYAPHNEDYGYVTLESFASSKAIITAHDSGGVLEFVRNEENGLVTEPTTDAIGHTVNRLVENKDLAKRLGKAARDYIQTSGLLESGWDQVISELLSPLK